MKRWCWYCKHRGARFRLFGNEGYIHCEHPDPDVAFGKDGHEDGMPLSEWESVRAAYNSCDHWEACPGAVGAKKED